jgi:hypothetical protein
MANLMKNEPKGYGVQVSMSGKPAADMKSGEQGMAKKRIPDAMTNQTGKDMKFEGGRMNGVCYTHDRKSCQ